MKKFISLSKYPGKTGEYFYNYFFKHYEIDAVYEPRGTDNLYKSIEDAIMDNIAGISISMPYKQAVIEYIERPTGYVEIYNSCNTITINNGMFKGHNTDIAGVELHNISLAASKNFEDILVKITSIVFALYLNLLFS